jgi:hypothetical protein
VSGGIAQLFLNLGTRRCVWSASRLGAFYPRGSPGTHCAGGWVGPGTVLDKCGKYRLTGIRSRAFQPVASRYTDCAIPATICRAGKLKEIYAARVRHRTKCGNAYKIL